jgi:glyoxylase-like metal-dependent hydrolase (beta-lactamase superfamily II)
VIHEVFPVGMLQCNCSIFGDEQTREAIVIDPGADVSKIVEILERHALKVKAIVITHAHFDHIGGAEKLRALTGAPVWMNGSDEMIAKSLPLQCALFGVPQAKNPGIDFKAKEGDVLTVGNAAFQVLHTPGHTPGSVGLYVPSEGMLVAGDTLFFESIGRTDLPGGSGKKIIQSIHEKIFTLPEETIVLPGHGRNTTVAHEKRFNPFVGALARS